jgi:hypothetical protein
MKITWKSLTILNVLGVSPEDAATVIAPRTQVGEEKISRIYQAKNGVLIQLRDTDNDAEVAHQNLLDRFGKDRVIEVYPARAEQTV